jgi:hypothetical protein
MTFFDSGTRLDGFFMAALESVTVGFGANRHDPAEQ